jgi:biotin-(acetyl-CoA carboxylase) ligase/methylase of polypeptide subunit release factors
MTDPIEREVELQYSTGRKEHWLPSGLEGLSVVLPATVYPPREDTKLLDECLASLGTGKGAKLLELGTGSGVIAISAALRGWQVTCCDINPLAVAAARGNAKTAGVDITVIEGGLEFGSAGGDVEIGGAGNGPVASLGLGIDGPFDVIVWNLPYLDPPKKGEARLGPLEDAGLVDLAGESGSGAGKSGLGAGLLSALEENPNLLANDGMVLLLHTNNERGNLLQTHWTSRGWATRHIADQRLGGDERLTCFAAWLPFKGREIEYRESVDSTNRRLLDEGGAHGRCLVASEQTAGRGQRERKWLTNQGDFAGSWLISDLGEPGALQLHAAVAVADAVASMLNHPLPSAHWTNAAKLISSGLEVRWPNDLWCDGGKLAGVLVEGRQQGEEQRVVLGIGVNCPAGVNGDFPTSSLEQLVGEKFSRAGFERALDASVASHFEVKERLGFPCKESRQRHYWALLSGHLGVGTQLVVEGRATTPFSLSEQAGLNSIDNGVVIENNNSYNRSWK